MDEGGAAQGAEVPIYYGERTHFWLTLTCPATPGHGARFLRDTPGQKVRGRKQLASVQSFAAVKLL